MKINYLRDSVRFDELYNGVAFIYDNEMFMKMKAVETESPFNAVSLESGDQIRINSGEIVCSCHVIIFEKENEDE